jgi:hypothetical protein
MAEDPSTGTGPEEGTPAPGRARRWLRTALAGVGLAALALCIGTAVVLYPYVRDDLVMDRIVRAVALEWRDFGRARAQDKLEYELAAAEVGPAVDAEACLLEATGDTRRVRCDWGVRIAFPGTAGLPLSFGSSAEIDPSGDVR